MTLRVAALFGCAVTSGFGAVNNDAKCKNWTISFNFGIGGMGLNIAYAASLVSAYPIIGVDTIRRKLNSEKQFGLTHGLIGNANEFKNELKNFK